MIRLGGHLLLATGAARLWALTLKLIMDPDVETYKQILAQKEAEQAAKDDMPSKRRRLKRNAERTPLSS